jgi:hypothetical protein
VEIGHSLGLGHWALDISSLRSFPPVLAVTTLQPAWILGIVAFSGRNIFPNVTAPNLHNPQ